MKVREAGQVVSTAFGNWLRAEIISSGVERNQELDRYDKMVAGLKLGYEDEKNLSVQKHRSHVFNRMPVWWEAFITTPPNHPKYDEMAAQIGFNALMQVSGTWRMQCYEQAADAEDYLRRRQSQPMGFDPTAAVTDRLATHLSAGTWEDTADFQKENNYIDINKLDHRRQRAIRVGDRAVRTICERVAVDLGQERSKSVREMLDAQYNWITLTADYVTLLAKVKDGDLMAVPLLEPKSISAEPKPKVITLGDLV